MPHETATAVETGEPAAGDPLPTANSRVASLHYQHFSGSREITSSECVKIDATCD